ncbi:AC3_0185 family rSAM-modified Cys-rich RiPP [Maledivibacter halophilus]|uniref:Modification target Cys-rich peptide, AC3_0185 family n=1 Tax=Maledivibacter halophilus TaxID=36842 RepID=A0A1T5MIF7_9FIRM|nr:AC3_0185 family rSAM-modified Cys-rich RiPP [Maledivibacter halophilus]SKC87669.1 modification target Cys-rich peptide, AC3_0185 family [Maledivibacter halophilus]
MKHLFSKKIYKNREDVQGYSPICDCYGTCTGSCAHSCEGDCSSACADTCTQTCASGLRWD